MATPLSKRSRATLATAFMFAHFNLDGVRADQRAELIGYMDAIAKEIARRAVVSRSKETKDRILSQHAKMCGILTAVR